MPRNGHTAVARARVWWCGMEGRVGSSGEDWRAALRALVVDMIGLERELARALAELPHSVGSGCRSRRARRRARPVRREGAR